MSRFVMGLERVGLGDAWQVGNKAARLGELRAAGFSVPAGVVVTADAFSLALESWKEEISQLLADYDLHLPEEAQRAAQAISAHLAALALPAEVQADLEQALATLGADTNRLAIRSSGTSEDGAHTSLAGQYETVLGVSGLEPIVDAILRCWRSTFSAHALAARTAAGGPAAGAEAGMAVLVQPIVDAGCAGVCLTVDPVRQDADRLIVNAAWGLGPGVVDGSVPSDTAWVQRRTLRLEQHLVAHKDLQVALGDGGSLQRIDVPETQQRAACLPDSWLVRVAQLALAAEQLFGSPQEVEWAINGRHVWILQSRPLTGLAPHLAQAPRFTVAWDDEAQKRHLWELTYWSKAEEPPLLPLEQAYTQAMEEMREETCRWLGVERNWARKWANGRLYAREIAVGLPKADMDVRRAAYEDLKLRWRQERLTAWDYWGPEIERATERLRVFDRDAAEGPALADHLEMALAVARRHTMLHPMLTFEPPDSYVEAYMAVSGSSGQEARTEATRLLGGAGAALSDLIDGLYELAQLARVHPAAAALVADPPQDLMAQLASLPQAGPFGERLEAFLAAYGERTGTGYGSRANLRTPTWAEQPQVVLQLAAAYLDLDVEAPASARVRARVKRSAAVEALCAACDDVQAVATFREELVYAQRAFAVLEEHNHYVDQMALGQVRQAVMAAARWLVAGGALQEQDDVLWLTFSEIIDALRAAEAASLAPSLASEVTEHQVQYEAWQKVAPPPILGLPPADLEPRPAWSDEVTEEASSAGNELRGLGASPGQARGPARVMNSVDALPALAPGDILVAHNVGPRWTPLFPILGGLVLNSGSVGQHAAATAREYGIPAVIATGDATRRIKDGAHIRVDGTIGVVWLEDGLG